MRTEKLTLGEFEIYGLSDGSFYLDGGAMFGVVPKVLWEKRSPADKKNRIKLSLNSILIKTKKEFILVETGIGSKLGQKFSDIYAVKREPGLLASLRELGIEPEHIHFVINTHLHFDHCGGNTLENEKGEIVPTFPKAMYIIQKGEWEFALNPDERDRPSYLSENFLPLEKYGVLNLVEGDREIRKGVKVMLASGHTSHHQCVRVESGGEVLFYLGDLVPTSAHIGLSYIMSYDLFPLDTLANKKRFYEQAVKEDWILAFDHDPEHYFGKIRKIDNKYEFQSLKK